jgi:NADH:ubiquinone oxidoreductase subunit 3 (subunit A)
MYLIYSEWCAILLFIVIAVLLSCLVFGLSYAFIARSPDLEKTSAYECGFNPFEDSRSKFDVRFYIVAILFIVFDLEIIFLCPWSLVLRKIDSAGFWGMMLFLILLTVGFVFEWRKGALDWS